jgi:hypothetical protein
MLKFFSLFTIFNVAVTAEAWASPSQIAEKEFLSSIILPANSTDSQNSDQTADQKQATWMQAGVQLAKEYVTELDQGRYAQSWEKGGFLFRQTVSQDDWVKALKLIRQPLGKAMSRKLQERRMIKDPYNLLKGQFMVVEYDTSFEKAPEGRELLILRSGSDGVWHVASYEVFYNGGDKSGKSLFSDQQRLTWKKEAAETAKNYVIDLDQERYAESWEKGGPLFKSMRNQQEWVKELNQMRKPLGKMISRTLNAEHLVRDPHDPAKSVYVVIEYNTSFEKAPEGREYLILKRGPNNQWYIGSYDVYAHALD